MTPKTASRPAAAPQDAARGSTAPRLRRARIAGVGMSVPPKVMTNADLEKLVDTTDEWIRTRTGIRERRIAEPGTATSDLAVPAARQALAQAGLNPKDLQLIIVATSTPDMVFPATACLVQDTLGAPKAACFDIQAACTGFVYALAMADQCVAGGMYDNALVIGAEVLSGFIDWTDRSTCVLFGDGAGACVLTPTNRGGILATHLASDGSGKDLLQLPGGGSRTPPSHASIDQRLHFLQMKGNEVFKVAVRAMADAAAQVLAKCGRKPQEVDCLIPHQANQRIIDAVMERVQIDPSKLFLNVERYGNMSAASTIVALCEALTEGRIKEGDLVVLVAFGAGLTWGAAAIEW